MNRRFPMKMPNMKSSSVQKLPPMFMPLFNSCTAFSTKSYLPISSRMKLPEMPGRIIAQIATAPHRIR